MKKWFKILISVILISVLAAGALQAGEYQEYPDDYSYLFEHGTSQKKDIELSAVERIAILYTSSPLPQSLFLDMEDQKSYYDPGTDIFYNIQLSKYINDMNEDEKSELQEIWRDADFSNWEFYYEGTAQMDYECHFAIETEDEIYHYLIRGVDASAPENLQKFISDILHTFWDSEILTAQ